MRQLPFVRALAATCALLLAGWHAVPARGSEAVPSEDQVKAAYLYNFTKFVEWPDSAFASPTAPIVIGIYGVDPFGPLIDDMVRNNTVAGRPLAVRRSVRMQDLRACHVVFVGGSREPMAEGLA